MAEIKMKEVARSLKDIIYACHVAIAEKQLYEENKDHFIFD